MSRGEFQLRMGLTLVSLDYGGETREVGAIDVNIDQDLVA